MGQHSRNEEAAKRPPSEAALVNGFQFLCESRLDALVSRRDQSSSPALLVATAGPAGRTVVALDRDGAASTAISAIISVGAISGSIVVSVVTRVRADSHAAERSINVNLG